MFVLSLETHLKSFGWRTMQTPELLLPPGLILHVSVSMKVSLRRVAGSLISAMRRFWRGEKKTNRHGWRPCIEDQKVTKCLKSTKSCSMLNMPLMAQRGFNGSLRSRKLSSFWFTKTPKFGDLTNQPPRAEEWSPSSALSFKREEVVAYAIGRSVK